MCICHVIGCRVIVEVLSGVVYFVHLIVIVFVFNIMACRRLVKMGYRIMIVVHVVVWLWCGCEVRGVSVGAVVRIVVCVFVYFVITF